MRTIVHGDAFLHNILAEGDEITALPDWELAHIGHLAEDLGYFKPIIEQTIDWDQLMEAYYQAGGCRLTTEQLDFFTLFSLVKLVTQVIQVSAAFEGGKTGDMVLIESGTAFSPKLIDRWQVSF